jgi:hypothetical protein
VHFHRNAGHRCTAVARLNAYYLVNARLEVVVRSLSKLAGSVDGKSCQKNVDNSMNCAVDFAQRLLDKLYPIRYMGHEHAHSVIRLFRLAE